MRRVTVWSAMLVTAVAVSCSSTPEGPTISISDDGWSATPVSVEAGGGEFDLTVSNETGEEQSFAVVFLRRGDPDGLPAVDGLLDLSRNHLAGDYENPDVALFSIVYPDYESPEGENVVPVPLTPGSVDPGEEITVTIGGWKGSGEPGSYVIVSWEPGAYEAGDYAAFEIVG